MSPTLIALAALAFGVGADAYPNPKMLVEVEALGKLDPKTTRVLDARDAKSYTAGHVPGAVWVDAAAWGKDVGTKDAGWPNRLASVGLAAETTAVVYATDPRDAARVWWILKLAGASDARILDGGWPAWQAAKGKVETKANVVTVDPAKLTESSGRLATKKDVLSILDDKSAQILDARSDGEFCGDTKSTKRSGHIPGATRLEWTDLLAPDQKFKSPSELKALFAEKKIDLDRPSVTYCQSGGRAAVLAFGLELMGAKSVRNYYKSWSEWGNAEDTPIHVPKK